MNADPRNWQFWIDVGGTFTDCIARHPDARLITHKLLSTPGCTGASAVHTHMTNTRLTDPEILEARYPVRVREWAIRRGSRGEGQFRGGEGMIREVEFLAELEVSLLTSRRSCQPRGGAGGGQAAAGRNLLRRAGKDDFVDLPSSAQFQASSGDVLRLETPGGGGWGVPVGR